MATVERTLHTIKVFQDSAERKTAENYVVQLEAVFKTLSDEWKVVVVAVTTDASGESRKARILFARGHPSIVVLDCYSHQINLIVGDYFKANTVYMVFVDKAVELISWLRSKTLVLALIREAQEGLGERPSAIIRAVITRWTAHYQAFRRLQQVQSALTALPPNERNFVRGDRKAREKCLAMVAIVRDPSFWRAISQMVRHLNPLAVACNVVQSAFCSLDTVLLAFGLLYAKYKDGSGFYIDEEDSGVCAVLDSLEKRWKNAGREQEVFIAAVLLNPYFKNSPFSHLPILNRAGIDLTFERLWSRFFKQPAPP
ncbi:ribonuclease H-like domain-containing protein, partial [Mycena sp. CBHHK59/15]